MLGKILEKVFITKKLIECKTSRNLKFEVFEMPDKKNNGKLFSKYKLLFLDQASSSSDPSQIFTLEFSIPRTSLPPLPSLSHFTLGNWNSSSTQSASWSSSVSLFCPTPFNHTLPQVLDIPNHMASQANKIYYQAVCRS